MSSAEYIPVDKLAGHLPRQVHLQSVRRWYRVGLRGVRLRVYRFGGRVFTTLDDLDEFHRELNRKAKTPYRARTGREQRKREREGKERLRQMGFKCV